MPWLYAVENDNLKVGIESVISRKKTTINNTLLVITYIYTILISPIKNENLY